MTPKPVECSKDRHAVIVVAAMAVGALFIATGSALGQPPGRPPQLGVAATTPSGAELGRVDLTTTCAPDSQELLERGLALLHHMTYLAAEEAFAGASTVDPDCALAYWGVAMSQVHPLWPDTLTEPGRARGETALRRAAGAAHANPRERAYVEAIAAYYDGGPERGERARLASMLEGWRAVRAAHPDDIEATAFYALSLLAVTPPEDQRHPNFVEAGSLLEGVLERVPEHPGGHHYLIHAYDLPHLAERALAVARRYGRLAPENAHALHMTSHIFTRLGLWEESIALNRRWAAAARERTAAGTISMHHLHALDYLVYALLQEGDEAAAKEVAEHLAELAPPFQDHPAVAYTFAAVPARIALERRHWELASMLPVRSPAAVNWERYPYLEAIPWFARALGAANLGRLETARAALVELARLERAAGALDGAYDWAKQVTIQRLAAEAVTLWASGDEDAALARAREAARIDDGTAKNPVTPSAVLPARELYGDLLLAAGRPARALRAYEQTLGHSPNRLASLRGAARAARAAGRPRVAARYERLLGDRPLDSGHGAPFGEAP